LGMEYVTGPYGIARAGYRWSDYHSISFGAAFGLTKRGTLFQAGWSFPTEGGKNTEWSVGLSYRM
ncbi:hypothetical protein IT157_06845, partial [bacterium]|nr:hypothetical protein [bacterium]